MKEAGQLFEQKFWKKCALYAVKYSNRFGFSNSLNFFAFSTSSLQHFDGKIVIGPKPYILIDILPRLLQ